MANKSVWNFFNKKEKQMAQCKLCLKSYKTSGNTTNLWTHIKRIHPLQANEKPDSELCIGEPDAKEQVFF